MLRLLEKVPMLLMIEVAGISNIFAPDFDLATFGSKFKRIRLKVQKDLLNSLHVTANHEPFLLSIAIFWEALIFLGDLDAHKFCFTFLDHVNFLDGFLDIKVANVLSEFARSKLCKIENVVDEIFQ